ncbi:MAG: glycosyltransferase [Firmicutes bacterium]|nr:glycosyltransferase [Bacillota bacterium]
MKGLTIIIPCYNVENYIEKCLDSIIKQSIEKYEIILIDDCSKDNTLNIIKKFKKEHSNLDITVLNNETNMGAGASRNLAVSKAKFDYISFVDSDDILSENYYKEMLIELNKSNASVVVCDIDVVYGYNNEKIKMQVCDEKETRLSFINNGMAASPCNKIFSKKEILKYPFAEGIMNEDIACVIPVLATTKKIKYCKSAVYYYVQHENSVQNSKLSFKKLDIIKSLEIVKERIKNVKQFKQYWDALVYQQLIMFLVYVPSKDNRIIYRAKFLKEFYKKTKDLKLRQNPYYYNIFLPNQGKKHKLYYKTFMKLNCNGFSFLSSLLISFYNFLRKYKKNKSVIKNDITVDDLIKCSIKQNKMKEKIKISVIIPNYNYDNFLYQRLYSILYQTKKIEEIIILDDCSNDNSRNTIMEITDKLKQYVKIRYVFNETNSGCVFRQWKKGLEMASGDYIWIAEADDYCGSSFLKAHLTNINKNNNISISYVDTAFIDKNGNIIMKTIKPEIDILKTGHWNKSFINDGMNEIEDYAYLNCTIANVSSVLLKKDDYSCFFEELIQYKQAGDWFFYLNVMQKGNVAFYNRPLNYYRVHGNNVTSNTKKQAHFEEIKKIHEYVGKVIRLDKKQKSNIKDRYKFLRKVWNVK